MPSLQVDVALGDRGYPIHVAPGSLDRAGQIMRPHTAAGRALVVADATVAALYADRLVASLAQAGIRADVATFPAGETSKNLETAARLWESCAKSRIDRGGAIVALGGGVTGDLAGFVAACWMRGVDFVQVPTSLLAMVDSSVGGKVGVNAAAGKNLVGAFKQPKCVVVDPAVVATMEPRKYRAGLAEVLKHGVIDDPDFFAWQESAADALASGAPEAVARAVADSCRIKARYVAQDETERGVRAHLNYGHTFGHALEQDGRYATYLHGEALAIGMRMAEKLATALGFLKDGGALAARQDALLKRYGLPLAHRCADPRVAAEKLADLCLLDKKAEGGTARFVLPTRLGKVEVRSVADLAAVREAFLGAMERA